VGIDLQIAPRTVTLPAEKALSAALDTGGGYTVGEKSGAAPYGSVSYADPGYQSDKKKRYPIDTEEHVRAALSYINKGENSDQYTPAQLKRVRARIYRKAKEMGIETKAAKSALGDDMYGKHAAAMACDSHDRLMDAFADFLDDEEMPQDEKMGEMNSAIEEHAKNMKDAAAKCAEMSVDGRKSAMETVRSHRAAKNAWLPEPTASDITDSGAETAMKSLDDMLKYWSIQAPVNGTS
jgi:hypothetical protein